MTAVKTAQGLCARCRAARAAAFVHTVEHAVRTSEDMPDVVADRPHRMTLTTWQACGDCTSQVTT